METTTITAGVVQESQPSSRTARRSFTDATTARIVGVLFIIGTAAGALSAVALTPVTGAPDILGAVGEGPDRALVGASLILVMGFALALIPLVLYPVLERRSEPLALGYVVFRTGLETVTYLGSALAWVVLASLGRQYVDAEGALADQLRTAADVVLVANDAVGSIALTFVFALGAMMFYSVLFRARLVPRWLSGWGLLAAFLWLAAGVLVLLGSTEARSPTEIAMALPIAIHEMVLAVWLITKGFNTTAVELDAISAGGGG